MDIQNDNYIPLSSLQHYAFCPRQFALIHVEQAWEENRFTAEGRLLHERVDSGDSEQRGTLRYERGVLLKSDKYKIQGKMDLLEVEKIKGETRYFPVEYKWGKPKTEDWDRVQVCAQALCLEEMRGTCISGGAIWYWEVRRREKVIIDNQLRDLTISVIEEARNILAQGKTPEPIDDRRRCRACSLIDICEPSTFAIDRSVAYIAELWIA